MLKCNGTRDANALALLRSDATVMRTRRMFIHIFTTHQHLVPARGPLFRCARGAAHGPPVSCVNIMRIFAIEQRSSRDVLTSETRFVERRDHGL